MSVFTCLDVHALPVTMYVEVIGQLAAVRCFYCVGPGDQTQMAGLMTSNLYPLKRLPGPWLYSSPPQGQPEEHRCDLKLPFLFTTREEAGVLLRLVFRG